VRRRLVLLALATTAMVTLAFLLPLALLIRDVAEDRALAAGRSVAQSLAPVIATGDRSTLTLALESVRPTAPGPVSLHLPDGTVLGAAAATDTGATPAPDGRAGVVAVADGVVVETPVLDGDGGTTVVRTAVPRAVLRQGVAASWAVLGGLGFLLVTGAVLIADRLGRTLVAPARDIADAARRLADGERDARAPVEGPPELEDVARALNTLADRIDALVAGEREAAADLSHRLRTPMTALRLDVDNLPATASRERLVAGLDDLERAVDRLIREARQPGTRVDRRADVAALARDRAAFWGALAEEESRPISVSVPATSVPTEVPGDELEAALDSLIGNVFAHTPPGTPFEVRVEEDGDATVLEVRDQGPGWSADDVRTRGVSGGGSTGLGLDIAARTVERHGGTMTLADAPGGGATVRLRLPRG
jgi:signal transduction histidine kinase